MRVEKHILKNIIPPSGIKLKFIDLKAIAFFKKEKKAKKNIPTLLQRMQNESREDDITENESNL